MRTNFFAFIIVSVILLSGCSSMGGEDKFSDSYIKSHIVVGKTTKAQVQQLYGVPDTNKKTSGRSTWVYKKNADFNTISSLTGYIPGTGAISSALRIGDSASEVSKISDKRSGNTEVHGDWFYITFNESDVVDYWSIE